MSSYLIIGIFSINVAMLVMITDFILINEITDEILG